MHLGNNNIYVLFYVAFLNCQIASAQEYSNHIQNNITIDIILNTKLITEQKGKIKELTSKYFFIPHSDSQQEVLLIDFFSRPKADSIYNVKGGFIWNELHEEYLLGYRAKVKTDFHQYPIESTPFPLYQIADNLKKYTEFDYIIDNDPSVNQFTKELIYGENELFTVVFKIGNWINKNIRYIKNVNHDVRRASTVYKAKNGDCADLSVLFLSMLRSVHIPSRLVSGIAKGDGDFGYHAWVEVYFEGVGWVPFDATSGGFGHLNSHQIKLNHDSSIPHMLLTQWEFYPYFGDVQIKSQKLPNVSAEIIEMQPHGITPFNINVHPFKNTIGINSYLPVVITSWNKTPYYTSNTIYVRDIIGIEIIGDQKFLLDYGPYEKKELKLMLKFTKTEQENKKYSSVLMVYDQFGKIDTTTINFTPLGRKISLKKGNEILKTLSTDFLENKE
ncbi:transglutaminase-like domain-containing protein [Arenibacter palladensis]|uniref:transglutaminase-like domain-containing protein n=1 Tax=Arenibacter palladensis TaxID=237373 RepID=UPI002FD4F035